jgi:hypothetical protein
MKKTYYYFYYLMVIFWIKTHKRMQMNDCYINGFIMVLLFTGLNVVSVIISIASKFPKNVGYLITIPLGITHYYFLSGGNRGKEIFDEFEEKFIASSKKKQIVALAILYVVATIGITIFVGVNYRIKHHVI